jgi:hypothetical protein
MAKLVGAWAKIDRAKKHIADLEQVIASFSNPRPYEVLPEYNPNTRQTEYKVVKIERIPESIPLIAGDAIHNLRSALDLLAYEMHRAGAYWKSVAEDRVAFRAWGDVNKYQSGMVGIIESTSPKVYDEIVRIEPYKGGNGHALWQVSELDNIDKHRLLLTAGMAFASVDVGPIIQARSQSAFTSGYQPASWEARTVLRPVTNYFPLQIGQVLHTAPPGSESHQQPKFSLEIQLGEPGVVEGEAVGKTLLKFVGSVECTVSRLEPLF